MMSGVVSRVVAVLALSVAGSSAALAASANVDCEMTFTLSGWSAFYKTASGTGTIKCSNGQSKNVKLTAKGGGLTVGKSTIEDGHGEFSAVKGIAELIGSYRRGGGGRGAGKGAARQGTR